MPRHGSGRPSMKQQSGNGTSLGRLPCVSFTTSHLPAAQQFEAYRADAIGFAELIEREPGAGCRASYTAWSLGPVVIKQTSSPALDQRRTPAMARRDGLDHWLVSLPVRSPQRIALGGASLDLSAARPMLLSCSESYEMQRPGAEDDWVIAFVARDAVRGLNLPGGLDGVQVLATPMGRLLVSFLRGMAARLPEMTAAQAPGLRDATLALLRATLAPSADNLAAIRPQTEAMMRERVRALIRTRLGAVTLTPNRLCREAGTSRSALYRLFEPLGGVAATIQMERLAEARRRLEDPGEGCSIQQIAEAVGFCDASVFSRAFRRRYGAAPGEVRKAAQLGLPPVAAMPRTAARGFLDMVARLES